MKPVTGRWIGIGIAIFGLILLYSGLEGGDTSLALSLVGIIIIIGGVIFSAVYWMCPSCDSFLPSRAWFAKYCHRCGKSIDKPRF